ncbi:MAG: FAD-dependent oxidoreductase [bacterium]
MTRPTDVLVLGGGIVGLSTALAAADRGMLVVVVDERRAGAASRAAAGLLAPSLEGLPSSALAMAITARDGYAAFVAHLVARTGLPVPLDLGGILEVAATPAELSGLARRCAPPARFLDQVALASMEPGLAGNVGALLHPGDGAVDSVALMRALERAVEQESRIERVTDRVVSIQMGGVSCTADTAGSGRLHARQLVFAPGAWAGGVPGLPRRLPVRPVRGELLRLDLAPIRHPTAGHGGYLVPRGGSLVVGATSEDWGFSAHTSDEGRDALLAFARRTVPALERAVVLEHWSGLRPVTPDGLPLLGRDPDVPSLVYGCGFSRNGILLAPWAAGELAALLSGEARPGLSAFVSPLRFDGEKDNLQ